MRTNIVIDDTLMQNALRLGGLRSKRETVEAGLRLLVQIRQQEQIRQVRGKLKWEGNLDTSRSDSSWIPQFYPQITQINTDFHRVAHE
jgi:Arc/MetJ family transcription regulator